MKKALLILFTLLVGFAYANDHKKEHVKLLNQVFATLENNIANPNWLETSAFKQFKRDMYSRKTLKLLTGRRISG
jgi:hypothetical protein